MRLKNEVIKVKDGYVYVDTCSLDNILANKIDSMGLGNNDAVGTNFETMVFNCDKHGNISNWTDLDKKNYMTEKEAIIGHEEIINKWKLK